MKIKKIKIKNFRCYYGEKNLQFSLDGKITFIYGLAGSGKSSFIDFINWMFYNKRDFADEGKVDKHEIYNDRIAKETVFGKSFDVQGIIEFEHYGIDYQLIKTITFEKLSSIEEIVNNKELILNYYLDGSWVEFSGDIKVKINEIVPESLSKYFFFHGEKTDRLKKDEKGSKSIKDSVYKLFGLTEYESAITHLGSYKVGQTLINQYHSEMNKKIKKLSDKSPKSLLEKISYCEINRKEHESKVNLAKRKREELEIKKSAKLKEIGKAQSSGVFEETIKTNEKLIKEYELNIIDLKKNIGNCFYKSFPFLALSELTRKSVMMISKEAKDIDNNHVVFNNINKPLLKEILLKNQCVCGKTLDQDMIKYIQSTIDTMPPKSYIFILKQFGAKGSDYIESSYEEYFKYDELINKITRYKDEIIELYQKNQDLREDLKKSNDTRKLSEELSDIEKQIKNFIAMESQNSLEMKKWERLIATLTVDYENAVKASGIKDEYEFKLSLLEDIKSRLEDLLNKKIEETKLILEQSAIEIYKQISTREEDFSNKKFVNDDFTFRKFQLSGGQEIVDVYSYIIGMIKALHKVDENSHKKDFPMIIDAPFSHADSIQSTNIFNVLPTIVPQVIMLTFDKNKIIDSFNSEKVGYCYMLKSDITQTETDIIPVDIEYIKNFKEESKK